MDLLSSAHTNQEQKILHFESYTVLVDFLTGTEIHSAVSLEKPFDVIDLLITASREDTGSPASDGISLNEAVGADEAHPVTSLVSLPTDPTVFDTMKPVGRLVLLGAPDSYLFVSLRVLEEGEMLGDRHKPTFPPTMWLVHPLPRPVGLVLGIRSNLSCCCLVANRYIQAPPPICWESSLKMCGQSDHSVATI